MELDNQPVAEVQPGWFVQLLRTPRSLVVGALVLFTGALTASACTKDNKPTMRVDVQVQIEVCSGTTCFTAPVSAASVSLDQGPAHVLSGSTTQDGVATFTPQTTGPATVRVKWGSLERVVQQDVQPGAQSLTVRFLESAKVAN